MTEFMKKLVIMWIIFRNEHSVEGNPKLAKHQVSFQNLSLFTENLMDIGNIFQSMKLCNKVWSPMQLCSLLALYLTWEFVTVRVAESCMVHNANLVNIYCVICFR
jgi:hypothetical protein